MHSTFFTQVWPSGWAKQVGSYFRGAAVFILLSLPSLWLLTHPFAWITGLEAMALSTVVPLLVFGLIGSLHLLWKGDGVSWLECAAITLCFACLQGYIFNTALHPQNRFNLLGGLLPNADPSMYLSLANQWGDGMRVVTPQTTRQFFPCFLSAMLWLCRRGPWGWRSILSAGVTCLIAMLLNVACYWIFFASPRPASNFWLCFYGMLTGGNWVTAMNEVGLDLNRTNLIAREKGMALLKAEPWLVLKGFWKACVFVWKDNTLYGHPPMAEGFRSWMKWLTVLGAALPWSWSIVQKRRAELEWFVLLIVLGTLFSLPFAPPWDGGRRVYAVAFPFLYLSPVMLIAWSWGGLRKILPLRTASRDSFVEKNHLTYADGQLVRLIQAVLGLLLLLTTVVPFALMVSKHHPIRGWAPQFCVPVPKGCPAKNLPSGYQIHLISDTGRTFLPWVTVSDFRRSIDGNLEKLRAPWLLDLLNDLPEGTTIGTACHSQFFVIGTDKVGTSRISQRHPILNRTWHRVIYDNDYPLPPYSQQILSQPKAPPLLPIK